MRFNMSSIGGGSRFILASLTLLFLLLQYSVWLGDFGFLRLAALDNAVAAQERDNVQLEKRNQRLRADVIDLKRGTDALEERAREQLGMVRQGEVFFQILETGQETTAVQPITR